jgi:excinuclease ABC subunit A
VLPCLEEKRLAARRLAQELEARPARPAAARAGLSLPGAQHAHPVAGELQRLRLATQLSSQLFGVIYVLDEPSAGLHPADGEALLDALQRLKASGNSVYVVEHDLALMRRADWLVDVGPAAGERGGRVLYSGPPPGLAQVRESQTRPYLFGELKLARRTPRAARGWLRLEGITRNNLREVDVALPLACLTVVTGVSGSGKSTLVTRALLELVARHLGSALPDAEEEIDGEMAADARDGTWSGRLAGDSAAIPPAGAGGPEADRPHAALQSRDLHRAVRCRAQAVRRHARRAPAALRPRPLLLQPAQGPLRHLRGRGLRRGGTAVHAQRVRALSRLPRGALQRADAGDPVARAQHRRGAGDDRGEAAAFFAGEAQVERPLQVLLEIGVGYLRLGQPATELSGGEAQRIKLATELQRPHRGDTLYVLDEPTTGLHAADADRLMLQLQRLVDEGNTAVVVEHEMRVVAQSDWVVDMGPGAGEQGGRVVATGTPEQVAASSGSRTAPYLAQCLRSRAGSAG